MSEKYPSQQNRWQLVLLLFAAFGVPLVAITTQFETITKNPWLALGLWLVYELLVIVLGFITDVWSQLKGQWAESTAGWVGIIVAHTVSRYRKRYEDYLIYRHRDFDVKGLTTQGIFALELGQVFVELSLKPQPPHLISADPIRKVPDELLGKRHTIWSFLTTELLEDQNLAIIGPPGCGKTTLLKHVTLALVRGKRQSREMGQPNKLPILLFLRNHSEVIKNDAHIGLVQVLQSTLEKWGKQAPVDWFERQLGQGNCLVMLDGLDEVADQETRQKVVIWVEKQMQRYGNNRFMITSRPFGYHGNPLSSMNVLEVQPFTSNQVRYFVNNWYVANEIMSAQKDDPGVRMIAQEGAEDLIWRLQSTPSLSALAVNPLLLTMIAIVHRYNSSLPGRRVELYKEICEVFLGKRQQSKGFELELTPAQKMRVLKPLAYHMMIRELRVITQEEMLKVIHAPLQLVSPRTSGNTFVKTIEQGSSLLLERENGKYSFAHLTFQEYLAAVHIRDEQLATQLVKHIYEGWWHETLRLYAALSDASLILAACLNDDLPPVSALMLAIEIGEEALEISPELRQRLEDILDSGVEDQDPERRRVVANALLAHRLRRMIRIDNDTYVDNDFITHCEYQLFLNDTNIQGNHYQPDHWTDYRFPAGQGKEPVVGVRPSDAVAFCKWLTEKENNDWLYRLPESRELPPPKNFADVVTTRNLGWWVKSETGYSVETIMSLSVTRNLARELAVKLDSDLARALDLARARALAQDIELDSDLVYALETDLACYRDLALDLDVVNPDFELTNALNLDLTSYLDVVGNLEIARNRARNLANDLANDLSLARHLDRAFNLDLRRDGSIGYREFYRLYVRLLSLWLNTTIIKALENQQRQFWLSVFKSQSQQESEQKLRELAEAFMNVYIDFVILEERIVGNLPAFESIRIVMERKLNLH